MAESNGSLVCVPAEMAEDAELVLELLAPACAKGIGQVVVSRIQACKNLFQMEN